ncbi:hypothetical protein FNV43_RR21987 [Rhamnella rubrinervis]|uniref:Uncharacterized protein n=1 Tax=Rhamnella rubrinervis TaxID=2594499 RepID=A0A8K0DPL6_9ROSA|nr:hypothetical protein FNV43_RR21987 [Rhamnella rubrinervis]
MSLRIKAVVDKFVQELKEALDADIQDRIMKEWEMQSYIQEREREVAEREAAWKAELSRREKYSRIGSYSCNCYFAPLGMVYVICYELHVQNILASL